MLKAKKAGKAGAVKKAAGNKVKANAKKPAVKASAKKK